MRKNEGKNEVLTYYLIRKHVIFAPRSRFLRKYCFVFLLNRIKNQKPNKIMEQNQTGSKAYLISIVMVAVLGGLLFGYDTAVISGAEKGLQAFFKGANDLYHR